MGRTLFHLWGLIPSYIENSSKASPLLTGSGRARRPANAQKLFNFSTLRCGEGTAEAGAFQRGGGGGEPQGGWNVLALGDGKGECAVEHVTGAERIHGMDREGRCLLQMALRVEPDRAFRPARPRQ